MKPILVLAFSFLAFLTNLPLAFSNVVLDATGNPLVTYRKYYILPSLRGPQGGGLKLAKTGNSDCPLTVLQDYSVFFPGSPVIFTIVGPTPAILTGTNLDIEFVNKPECAESSKWLVFSDEEIHKPSVGLSGQPGEILDGKFKIENNRIGYKLVFCLNESPSCLNIGRFDAENGENGKRLTFTEQEAFDIVFLEAFDDDKLLSPLFESNISTMVNKC